MEKHIMGENGMNNIRACAEEVVLQEYVYKDIGAF